MVGASGKTVIGRRRRAFIFASAIQQELVMPKNWLVGSVSALGITSSGNNAQYLNVFFNSLVGSLPGAATSFSSMQHMYVSYNMLVGSIPGAVSFWSSMQHLEVSSNMFAGSLPDAVLYWTGMQHLHVESNKLIGSIPDATSSWSRMQELYLSYNQLCGISSRRSKVLVQSGGPYLLATRGSFKTTTLVRRFLEGFFYKASYKGGS